MKNSTVLISIGMVVFLDNVGTGIVMPLLPTLFMNNTIGLLKLSSFETRSFYFGLCYMLFPLTAILGNPILGYISDYKGRKFVIVIGMLGFVFTNLFTVLSIISHNLWLFLLTRLMSGFFSGSYAAANAIFMDISADSQEKIKNIKLITLIAIMGFIISPAFSMFIPVKVTATTLAIPFLIVFLLSGINVVFIILFLPNVALKCNDGPNKLQNSVYMFINATLTIFNQRDVLKRAIVFGLFQIGYIFYFQILALQLAQVYEFNLHQISIFFVIMLISYACGMYVILPLLRRVCSNILTTQISLFVSGGIIGLLNFNVFVELPLQMSHFVALWGLNVLFFAIIPIASITLFSQFIDIFQENQGLAMGIVGQVVAIASIFSGVVVSISGYFSKYNLLVPSFIMFVVFILEYVSQLKQNRQRESLAFIPNS